MNAHRTYELIYIVTPEATDDQVADLHAQVDAIVQRFSGRIESTENWGRKRLAYEVAHQKEGIYVLELIHGPADMVKELDRRLKVNDQILRHLVVRVDEDMQIVERRQAERRAERIRRRVARGLPPEPEPEAAPAEATQAGEEQGEIPQTEA